MVQINGPDHKQLLKDGDNYARRMTAQVRAVLRRAAFDITSIVPSIDDIIRLTAYWQKNVPEALLPYIDEYMGEVVNDVRAQLANELDEEVVVPSITNVFAEVYLEHARNRLNDVGNIVWEHARAELVLGLKSGESIAELRDRVMNSITLSRPRAEVIARTEVIGAANAGAFEQMKATGLPATKKWLATRGNRTRPTHAEVNGTVVPLNEKFTVGGWPCDRPHDPALPPGESVNCRCTLTYEILDEPETILAHLSGKHDQAKHGHGGGVDYEIGSDVRDDSLDEMSELWPEHLQLQYKVKSNYKEDQLLDIVNDSPGAKAGTKAAEDDFISDRKSVV